MGKHIFISYSKKDRDFAWKLAEDLTATGREIWIDREIGGGADWEKTIEEKLRDAAEVVIILSPNAVNSEWVMHEGSMAYGWDKPMYPVLYQQVEKLPIWSDKFQWVDFTGLDYDVALTKLLTALTPPNPVQDLLDREMALYAEHEDHLISESVLRLFDERWASLTLTPGAEALIARSKQAVASRQKLQQDIVRVEAQLEDSKRELQNYEHQIEVSKQALSRSRRLTRWGLVVLAVVLLVSVISVVVSVGANLSANAASERQATAESAQATAEFEQNRQGQISIALRLAQETTRQERGLSILLAAQAWLFNNAAQGPVIRDVDEALRNVLKNNGNANDLTLPASLSGAEPIWTDPTITWVVVRQDDGDHVLERNDRQLIVRDDADAGETERRVSGPVIRWSRTDPIITRVTADGAEQTVTLEDGGGIESLTTSEDRNTAVAVTGDGAVYLVRFDETPSLTLIRAHQPDSYRTETKLASDGSRIVVAEIYDAADPDYDEGYGPDLRVLVWDIQSNASLEMPQTLYDGRAYIEGLAGLSFDPGGRYLVLRGAIVEGSGPALIWDLQNPEVPLSIVYGAGEYFQTAAFSPDGSWLALGTASYGVDGIPLGTGIQVVDLDRLYDAGNSAVNALELDTIESIDLLQFSGDSERLLSVDGATVRVWRLLGRRFVPEHTWSHDSGVFAAAWTHDEQAVLVVTQSGVFRYWDLEPPTAQPVVLSGPNWDDTTRYALAISPDGHHIAAGGDGTVGIWNLDTPDNPVFGTSDSGTVVALAYNPSGTLLVGGKEGGNILIWEADTPENAAVLGEHPGGVTALSIDREGEYALSGGGDGTVRVWSLSQPGESWIVDDTGEPVTSVALTADNAQAAWAFGSRVRLGEWKSPAAAPDELVFEAGVVKVGFVGDRLLAVLANGSAFWADGNDQTLIERYNFSVSVAAIDRSGRWLATADSSIVYIWDLVNGGTPAVLSESNRPVTGLEFTPDGDWLVSSSSEIFDIIDDISPGHLWLRPTPSGMFHIAEQRVWRNLTCAEWAEFVGSNTPYRRTFESLPYPDDYARCGA